MTGAQLDHLVRMVNQIAANLQAAGDTNVVAEQTASHLRRFWSPAMRRRLADYACQDGADLTPAALQAARSLALGEGEAR